MNHEMMTFYWSLGKEISEKMDENQYGSQFYNVLSRLLCEAMPNTKGFSPRNLRYMSEFYEMYKDNILQQPVSKSEQIDDDTNLQQLVANFIGLDELAMVPWGHHCKIISKCKGKGEVEKSIFYVRQTIKNNWSRAVLQNYLDGNLYERKGKAISNFKKILPKPQSDLAQEITKDPYNFDFLAIREGYDEKELKDALMDSITSFLLELGQGFAFVGREYRMTVGETEQYIDLLFYHINLKRYIVIEVKAVDFKPEFTGQLGTYVAAVNHQLKTEKDDDTIGLLVCRGKDNILARYALESVSVPIGISEYKLAELLPDDYKGSLPTIEELEDELRDCHR